MNKWNFSDCREIPFSTIVDDEAEPYKSGSASSSILVKTTASEDWRLMHGG
ncbi:hypothetical protein [Paenibacillus sp. GCM10012306]|uniref:hypothetical protein n=1 Tax=Paenibacillus sp. GCM10012306 TaxID=3317342 RepID=UPI0036D2D2E2